MQALSYLPSSPILSSKPLVPRSSSSIQFLDPFASFGLAVSDLMLSLLSTRKRLQEYAQSTQPENGSCYSRIQSLSLSEPCLHASVLPDQLLQVRAVQSSVMVSYQKVCRPYQTASIGHADVETQPGPLASTRVSAIQSSPIFST
jgi:hypothetical protein